MYEFWTCRYLFYGHKKKELEGGKVPPSDLTRFLLIILPCHCALPVALCKIFVFRLLREAEERRRRLTSHRLLQPRTTASIRNRYICKVIEKYVPQISYFWFPDWCWSSKSSWAWSTSSCQTLSALKSQIQIQILFLKTCQDSTRAKHIFSPTLKWVTQGKPICLVVLQIANVPSPLVVPWWPGWNCCALLICEVVHTGPLVTIQCLVGIKFIFWINWDTRRELEGWFQDKNGIREAIL